MDRYAAGAFALLCCIALFIGGIAAADQQYGIDIGGSVDTPTRQETLEGEEYTVSAIGVVSPGDAIEVSVDVPADVSYDLYLYDDERRSQERIENADATETFDGDYSVGSYLVAIWVDGQARAVHPVVVQSYEVTVDAPSEVEPGESVEFTVDVSNVPDTPENLNSVQVVVSKNGDDQALTATESGDGIYTAETTLAETGSYMVYANVRGSDEVNGRKELLGASQSSTVAVRESTPTTTASPTPTPTEVPSSGGGETSDGTPTATETPTQTSMDTASPTATATATETSMATQTATASPTATLTPNDVVTPNQESPTETTGGLSALVAVVAVLGFGALTRRRR